MTKLETLAARASKSDLAYKLTLACLNADAMDQISTDAMDALDAEPENEALDAAADKAYSEYWNACREISVMLIDITGGMIDKKTAFHMAVYKRAEIVGIYKKANRK